VGEEITNYEAYLKVNYYLNLYNFKKAEVIIDDYLKKNPQDPFILTEKAALLKNIKNDFKNSSKFLKKSLSLYPDYYYSNYLYASILFFNYTTRISKKAVDDSSLRDEAIQYLKRSIKDNGKYYHSLFLMGLILFEKGDSKGSNKYFQKASQFKQTSELYFYMALNFKKLKDIEGEIHSYKRLLSLSPDNYKALSVLSQYYLKQQDYKSANIYLEKLYLKDPGDKRKSFDYLYSLFSSGEHIKFLQISESIDLSFSPILIYAKALILNQNQDYSKAIELLKLLKTQDSRTKFLLADIHMNQTDYYRAYQILGTIEEEHRNYIYFSLQLKVLFFLNMNERIINLFERLNNQKPVLENFSLADYYIVFSAYSTLDKIDLLVKSIDSIKSKFKKESKHLHELITVFKGLAEGNEFRGDQVVFDENMDLIITYLIAKKRFSDAILLLEKLNFKEENLSIYLKMCAIYIEQDNTQKVESLVSKLEKKYPKSVELKNFYAYFLALQNRRLNQALQLSEYTLSKEAENFAYMDTYGFILYNMGNIGEASIFLEKAYKKNPFDPEIIDHLVNCYREKNNTQEIIKIYKYAIDNGVDFKDRLVDKMEKLKSSEEKNKD
jgi:tetratricopeptide (TPR) repeat protein